MKKILILIVLICGALMSLTLPPVDKTKVPIKNVQGLQDSLAAKVNVATLESATGTFYTKAQIDSIKALKADLASPTFTGTPLVPTAAAGTNTTQAASTAFVNQTAVRKIYSNAVQHSNTGNTNENTILTFTIPGGSIGENGSFHITTLASFTSSTNLKKYTVKFNGTAVGYFSGASTGLSARSYFTIYNRNSTSSQVLPNAAIPAGGAFATAPLSSAITTTSINTSADITVTVTAQLALGTETISLEAIEVLAVY